jgi:hypothetical protein
MAYTDFRGLATVLHRGPAFRAASTGAMKVGDLVSRDLAQADASAAQGSAHYVCSEGGESGASLLYADWAVLRKPDTVSSGGDATAGDHSGTLGDNLFLSTTAGAAVELIDGDGIYQIVGLILSTQDILLKPSHNVGDYFEDCEKETSAKTLDINDSGKAFVVTGTSDVVITLPATAAQGVYTVINGSQDGDKLTSVSPNSSDGIVGWDFSNGDDGDATNTKATSKSGDYLTVMSGGLAGGFYVFNGRGRWAGA